MLATLLMGIVARMPLAVAPAMGVNAYFTYNVVGFLATKRVRVMVVGRDQQAHAPRV